MSLIFITLISLIAFAANSILCRIAFSQTQIDPASFTLIRILSGSIVLYYLSRYQLGTKVSQQTKQISWWPSFYLFTYMICFSFAYISLSAATGALILFAAVQLTILIKAYVAGTRYSIIQLSGVVVAFAGLVYLVFPELSKPSLFHAGLMILAGCAWGAYTLAGNNTKASCSSLTFSWINFYRASVIAIPSTGLFISTLQFDLSGAFYAILSGALASGIGYALWYSVLPKLKSIVSASIQLTVPVITAVLAIWLLAEPIDKRLILSAFAILGGVGISLYAKSRKLTGINN